MGGFIYIFTRSHESKGRRGSLGRHCLAGVLLATCLTTTPTLAQTRAVEKTNPQPHHAVSTSASPPAAPAPLAGLPNVPTAKTTSDTLDVPPLTRAATRLRIEEMSPVRWLANYGIVSVGQLE
jgi:hypothetical protein